MFSNWKRGIRGVHCKSIIAYRIRLLVACSYLDLSYHIATKYAVCHSGSRSVTDASVAPMSFELASESILKQYYPHVENLGSYLSFILQPVLDPAAGHLGHAFRPHERDSHEYSRLVDTTLVATRNQGSYHGAFKAYKPPIEADMLYVRSPMLVSVF
jgi:hypothetical protein